MKLVINGESWGVYGNAQQPNKDFTDEWFDSRSGVRWKVSPGPGSQGSSLTYNGPSPAAYAGYQLKSKKSKLAVSDLIHLCEVLNKTPVERLHEDLESVMSVDCALWFLALDNVLLDTDGYHSRGADYMLYQHPDDGRFHVLTYDSNETFRTAGRGGPPSNDLAARPQRGGPPRDRENPRRPGGGPPGGPGDPGEGLKLSPFAGEDKEQLALINRLLANPILRARYIAHVRTLTNEWLDWKKIGPVAESYRALIDDEVKADTRKLYSYDDFVKNQAEDVSTGRRATPGLQRFVNERGEFLRSHADLRKPHGTIAEVTHHGTRSAVLVSARVEGKTKPAAVILYHAPTRHARFQQSVMVDDGKHGDGGANDGVYAATIPVSSRRYYYVEARSGGEQPSTMFYPTNTERGSIEYLPKLKSADDSPVVINEVMAVNTKTLKDPQGEFDDWIELHNKSDEPVDLSGWFLTDSSTNQQKWAFPNGTIIAGGGYLVVWADEDKSAGDDLHANFKLSKEGETISLVSADGRVAMDSLTFGVSGDDDAFGRDGNAETVKLKSPTPGAANASN